MKDDHQKKLDLMILAGDVRGLAKALDCVVDRPDMPGMQAIINSIMEKSEALEDAMEEVQIFTKEAAA